MGLYDTMKVEYLLPGNGQKGHYQNTMVLDDYKITEDGELILHYEVKSKLSVPKDYTGKINIINDFREYEVDIKDGKVIGIKNVTVRVG
jgi:hypothetical protein